MSVRSFIAAGSNIDAERNVSSALELLGRRVRIVAVSRFYRTPALGAPGSPDFLNGVVEIESELEPRELKRLVLLEVEDELGRERGAERNAPRTIDLDLVLHGELVCSEDGLELPAAEILERAFVALPLLELEPKLVLPGTDRPLSELAAGLSSSEMVPAESFNARLRRVEGSGKESG
ncbi:MAG: 2-amino-4-hydroxy-6-hydroxymethyldihydropteridine diphosphokinase [Gaiellaceae bacterium]